MLEPLGRRLRALRRELLMSLRTVAAAAGVSHVTLFNWETGRERVPAARLEALAAALQVAPRELVALHCEKRRRKVVGATLRGRRQRLPAYECRGSLESASDMQPWGTRICAAAQKRCGPAVLAEMDEAFPRDSALELLFALACLGSVFGLVKMSVLDTGCQLLVIDPRQSRDRAAYIGHLARHALLYEGEDMSIALFPQVTVASLAYSQFYRLDFLCLVQTPDGRRLWIDIEVDGKSHEQTVYYDQRRTDALGLPRLAVTRADIMHADFVVRLLQRCMRLLDASAPH